MSPEELYESWMKAHKYMPMVVVKTSFRNVYDLGQKFGMANEDFEQCVRLGVLMASRSYDESRGAVFNTWAHCQIFGEMTKELRKYKKYYRIYSDSWARFDDGEGNIIESAAKAFSYSDSGYAAVDAEDVIERINSMPFTERERQALNTIDRTEQDSAKMMGVSRGRVHELRKTIRHKLGRLAASAE